MNTKRAAGSARTVILTQVVVWGLALSAVSVLSGVRASTQQTTKDAPAETAAPQQHSATLADGPGKDTLQRVCSKCHSANQVMANGRDRQGWEDEITKMVGLGAVGTDAEFTDILEYLVKNYPAPSASGAKVNVNKATAPELQSGLSLSTAQAQAVVAYREKNGSFKTIDDLKKVPELDAKKLDDSKDKLAF